jgi:ubiquinone/menaquinone biosynthesis C-methylase UbiE
VTIVVEAPSHEPQESFQISAEVAELYEERFVPALFADWVGPVLDAAGVVAGDRVLDVACGTGILARTAADRVGRDGLVVGVDLNPAMLDVARRVRPGIGWRMGDAHALPFETAAFDRVVCQMALMFFRDRAAAIEEMARVVRPGQSVAVMTPATLDTQPAWRPFVEAAARHAGPDAVRLLGTYWAAGNLDELTTMMTQAGLKLVSARTRIGTATFESIDSMISTEVESTPLAARLSSRAYSRIRTDARTALSAFQAPDGRALLPLVGHIVVGRRPSGVS